MKKLIIIALFLAIVTGISIYYYASSYETRFSVKTVSVAVAAKAITKNTVISPEMIIIKDLPVTAVNDLTARGISDIKGLIAKENIELNEQILTTKLSDPAKKDSGLSYLIKEGYRALTIKTDEITGVAGYINKGDHVDIMAVMINSVDKSISSQMIVENIEVLEAGTNPGSKGDKGGGEYSSVTVAVSTGDMLKVNYALSEGKYRLVLRSVIDKNIVNPAPYSQ